MHNSEFNRSRNIYTVVKQISGFGSDTYRSADVVHGTNWGKLAYFVNKEDVNRTNNDKGKKSCLKNDSFDK